jgi:hypothetical protein
MNYPPRRDRQPTTVVCHPDDAEALKRLSDYYKAEAILAKIIGWTYVAIILTFVAAMIGYASDGNAWGSVACAYMSMVAFWRYSKTWQS